MTRRDRLMATLRGEPVDRPPVSFYEINGLDEHANDPDPFNIYTDPSWGPLIALAARESDRIVMRSVPWKSSAHPGDRFQTESVMRDGSKITTRRIEAGGRVLTETTRRDPDVNTVWREEHLLKSVDDLRAYLELPAPGINGSVDTGPVLLAESAIGDSGIVMIDTADPLCLAASLFNMAEYTVIALTEQALFRRLLERFASVLLPKTEAVAAALPGRLWRIYGPEYASPPYLPPYLFREYVCVYLRPMIELIHNHGGYARVHCHGNIGEILDDIVATGADGIDPIEPPPQGDVELGSVRKRYGNQLVLFGNLEVSDIENMPTAEFREIVKRAIDAGTSGSGRGFVLMPSSCPYGRRLSTLTLRNYETMIEVAHGS